MASFEFNVTFQDGAEAGKGLMELARRCSTTDQLPAKCTVQQLRHVFEFVEKHGGRRLPYVEGFLTEIVRMESIKDSIIDLWPIDEFLANQSNYVPICNISPENQLIQFASWNGEVSDGDGWCFDLCDELVRCVPVACDEEDGIDYLKRCTYGCFPSLDGLAPYLLSVAEKRTYLRDRLLRNTKN